MEFLSLDREKGRQILKGILKGCQQSDCDLVGGETAEMPDHYNGENFDLVGFSMGVNEEIRIIDGSNIEEGNYFGTTIFRFSLKWFFFNQQNY